MLKSKFASRLLELLHDGNPHNEAVFDKLTISASDALYSKSEIAKEWRQLTKLSNSFAEKHEVAKPKTPPTISCISSKHVGHHLDDLRRDDGTIHARYLQQYNQRLSEHVVTFIQQSQKLSTLHGAFSDYCTLPLVGNIVRWHRLYQWPINSVTAKRNLRSCRESLATCYTFLPLIVLDFGFSLFTTYTCVLVGILRDEVTGVETVFPFYCNHTPYCKGVLIPHELEDVATTATKMMMSELVKIVKTPNVTSVMQGLEKVQQLQYRIGQ